MKHPVSRALFAYWDMIRAERSAPERSEVDPGAIRHILADTFIAEIDPESGSPFRLAGTRICALFGRELKGSAFAHLWPEDRRRDGEGLVQTVADERSGAVAGLTATTTGGRILDLELLLLPLRHRGKTHERVLGSLSAAQIPPLLGIDLVSSLELRSLRVLHTNICRSHPLNDGTAETSRVGRQSTFRIVQGGKV